MKNKLYVAELPTGQQLYLVDGQYIFMNFNGRLATMVKEKVIESKEWYAENGYQWLIDNGYLKERQIETFSFDLEMWGAGYGIDN